jgi:hypothetical protein
VCLFHATYGGEARASEYANTRNGTTLYRGEVARELGPADHAAFLAANRDDLLLYHEARRVFDERARAAGCV